MKDRGSHKANTHCKKKKRPQTLLFLIAVFRCKIKARKMGDI